MLFAFVAIALSLFHESQLNPNLKCLKPSAKYSLICVLFLTAIAQVYIEEGDAEFNRKNIENAAILYTSGIDVNCKDDKLNAVLYFKRYASYAALGESTHACLSLPSFQFD